MCVTRTWPGVVRMRAMVKERARGASEQIPAAKTSAISEV